MKNTQVRHPQWTKSLLSLSLALLMILSVFPALSTPAAAADVFEGPVVEEYYPDDLENLLVTAYYFPAYSDEMQARQLEYCQQADVDIISNVFFAPYDNMTNWYASQTFERYSSLAAAAAEKGMKVFTRDQDVQSFYLRSDAENKAVIDKYKDMDGIGGYFLVDEPYNANPFAQASRVILQEDPDAIPDVNFLPRGCYGDAYIDQLEDYGRLLYDVGGFLSLDVYCFGLGGGVDEYNLFKNYDDIRLAGLHTHKNTAVYVQSVGSTSFGYRRPDANTLRYNIMAALAYGVKNIKYFTWGSPIVETEGDYTEAIIGRRDSNCEPTDLFAPVCQINKQIHTLGQYIAPCDAVLIYHAGQATAGAYETVPSDFFVQPQDSGRSILSCFRSRRGAEEYLMVVNKDYTSEQTLTYTLSGISLLRRLDNATGAWSDVSLADGSLSVTLAAGDCVLYQLPEGTIPEEQPVETQNLALQAQVWASSSSGADGMYINRVNDGKTSDGYGVQLQTSDDRESEWLMLDLGSVKTLNRIDLYPAGSGSSCGLRFPNSFTLSVSADGTRWTKVARAEKVIGPISKVPVYRFETLQARYVRLDVTALSFGKADIGEIAIYNDDGTIEDNIPTNYTPPAYNSGDNLALNMPIADYSSTYNELPWVNLTHINDGITTSGAWNSMPRRHPASGGPDCSDDPEYITIDLGAQCYINKVVLTPHGQTDGISNYFPVDYQIQVSSDGVNFKTATSVTDTLGCKDQSVRTVTFDTTAGRYVRFLCTKMSDYAREQDGYIVALREMEVYGDGPVDAVVTSNVALNKPITGYSSAYNELPWVSYTHLNDGITDSGAWNSMPFRHPVSEGPDCSDDPEYIIIDLEEEYSINKVVLTPHGQTDGISNFFPVDYQIQVSSDGVNFKTAASVTDTLGCKDQSARTITFDSIRGRYVRFVCTKMSDYAREGDGYMVALREMEVYGNIPAAAVQNVALNKSVVDWSSTTDMPEWTCHHTYANDGNTATAWASALGTNSSPDTTEYLLIDLGGAYDLSKIVLVPRPIEAGNGHNSFPDDYQVLVSADGIDFSPIVTEESDNTPVSSENRVFDVSTVPAAKNVRYIKFNATKLTVFSSFTYYVVELAELQAFGLPAGSESETPGASGADKSTLQALYNAKKDKQNDNFTDESWAAFQTALAAAGTVLENADATQEEVDAALAALLSGLNGLQRMVDKSALQTLYNANKDKANDNFTDESWATFQSALTAAGTVLDDENATQNEVNTALAALQSAVDGLAEKKPDPTPDPDPIKPVIPTILPVLPTMPETDELPFRDVRESDWYYDAVEYVYENGLMNGTGKSTFSPNSQTTRGMIVTILYRQSGSPKVSSDNKTWWSDARVWAMECGISDGTNMDGNITREQLAAMLYRYAKLTGADVRAGGDLNKFSDAAQVSGWAVEAMQWAVGEGILGGRPDGTVDPKGLATRAEVAAMLMRFGKTAE